MKWNESQEAWRLQWCLYFGRHSLHDCVYVDCRSRPCVLQYNIVVVDNYSSAPRSNEIMRITLELHAFAMLDVHRTLSVILISAYATAIARADHSETAGVGVCIVLLCWLVHVVGVGSCNHDNGGCDQICIPSYGGRVECRCRPGYRLDINGRSCKGPYIVRCRDFVETKPQGSR